MPTNYSNIDVGMCGTYFPIWMDGVIPGSSHGRVTRKACVFSSSDVCCPVWTIEVVNCLTFMLYKLVPTVQLSGYCFDNIKTDAAPEAPPSFKPDYAAVRPELYFTEETTFSGRTFFKPRLKFWCDFKESQKEQLFYSILWYINDVFLKQEGPELFALRDKTNLREDELIALNYKLDIMIKCIVRASTSKSGFPGNRTVSAGYWMGIQVLSPNVRVQQGHTATVQLRATFPFGCTTAFIQSSPPCGISVVMYDPYDAYDCLGSSISVRNSHVCGLYLPGLTYTEFMDGKNYTNVITNMTITTKDTNDYTSGRISFVLKLVTEQASSANDIVQGNILTDINVVVEHTASLQGNICYSNTSRHMLTFDGRYYENENSGDFIMYRHGSKKQEVQIRIKPCLFVLNCTCAVALRAGGDLFIINICSTPRLIEFVSRRDSILQVRRIHFNSYKVYMPVGTIVEINIVSDLYINVEIYPSKSDVNETIGLCGVLNNNQDDDFKLPSGLPESNNNVFATSWRIPSANSLFSPHNFIPTLWDEGSYHCVCPAALNTTAPPTTASGNTFDPMCSASLFLSCRKKVINQSNPNSCEANPGAVNSSSSVACTSSCSIYGDHIYDNHTSAVPLLRCEESTDSTGTMWNFTYGNVNVTMPCPFGFIGNVTRFCNASATWKDPNYGDCVNETLMLLNNEFEVLLNGTNGNSISTVLSKLNEATDPSQVVLQKNEIEIVVSLLDRIVGINTTDDILTSPKVYDNFLATASNILDVNNKESWLLLISNKKLGAEIVLRPVEQFLQRISASVNKDELSSVLTLKYKNLDVEIGYKLQLERPRNNNNSAMEKRTFTNSFILPILEDNNYTITAVLYKNMSDIMPKRIFQHGATHDMPLDISPEVLSLQLSPKPVKLSEPLQLIFKTFDTTFTSPLCSYWKFDANAEGGGAWSNDGCNVGSIIPSGIVCECDHLTNFAIIMAPSEITDQEHNATLSIISVVGCAVSLLSLTLTLLGHFSVWRYVKSRRTYILMNICVALLLSYTTFLAGVNRTENKVVCTVIAALLHYFFLTVFFLMLVQGIWVAVSVLYVFATKAYLDWLLPLGWLIPVPIVGISLGIARLDGYGNKRFCWLSVSDGLIWAFAGPAALVIVVNGVIIGITIRKLLSTASLITKTKQERARASLKGIAVLLPLTGVTWALGIFSVNENLLVFQYLFTVFNSFQGLFVFLFHCVGNKALCNAIKTKRWRRNVLATYEKNSKKTSNNDQQELSTTDVSRTKK